MVLLAVSPKITVGYVKIVVGSATVVAGSTTIGVGSATILVGSTTVVVGSTTVVASFTAIVACSTILSRPPITGRASSGPPARIKIKKNQRAAHKSLQPNRRRA